MLRVADRVAPTPATVLIVGETGTGKELIARRVHARSGRGGPFVAVNCAAIPRELVESTLFGHRKGAFTSAVTDTRGAMEAAGDGTLFLDEIGSMPLEAQPKLLRAIQERAVTPVGATGSMPVKCRFVAASNRPLHDLVEEGTFREDLFYRLHVVLLSIPPLRDRPEDIPLLAAAIADRLAFDYGKRTLTPAAINVLRSAPWRGNVRQLQNAIERAFVHSTGKDTVDVDDLPDITARMFQPNTWPKLRDVVWDYIERVIASVDGNKSRAAEILGCDRGTIYRWMDRSGRPVLARIVADPPPRGGGAADGRRDS